MIRFPGFLKGNHERRDEKDKERALAMKGWDASESADAKHGFASQLHMSRGMGHHFARNSITRGRGQVSFKGK
ncbi:MAG: hypothetical protein JXA24_03235 [Proteobacteria bacterium]|nr:hypothetical protein [Pseudomonadota bacterium]